MATKRGNGRALTIPTVTLTVSLADGVPHREQADVLPDLRTAVRDDRDGRGWAARRAAPGQGPSVVVGLCLPEGHRIHRGSQRPRPRHSAAAPRPAWLRTGQLGRGDDGHRQNGSPSSTAGTAPARSAGTWATRRRSVTHTCCGCRRSSRASAATPITSPPPPKTPIADSSRASCCMARRRRCRYLT